VLFRSALLALTGLVVKAVKDGTSDRLK